MELKRQAYDSAAHKYCFHATGYCFHATEMYLVVTGLQPCLARKFGVRIYFDPGSDNRSRAAGHSPAMTSFATVAGFSYSIQAVSNS